MVNGTLFDSVLESDYPTSITEWRPEMPPSLNGINEVFMDYETTGLRWWEKDEPCGVGLYVPEFNRGWYLPISHPGGNNLPREQVVRYLRNELPGKLITNHSTKFEIHMSRKLDVDLEGVGCKVSDVSHYAALLDDHRQVFNQEALVNDYLDPAEQEAKVKVVEGVVIDPSQMSKYPAGLVAVRAIGDVRQVWKLKNAMWPLLEKEDLHRVRQLEDDVMYATAEMEWNGSPIDHERLNDYDVRSQKEIEDSLWRIWRETGLKVNPASSIDMKKLFNYLKLPVTEFTEAGNPSFSAKVLATIKDPLIQAALRVSKLMSLRSKVICKIRDGCDSRGIYRYALHQLKAQKDEFDEHAAGTVSGRYSSTGLGSREDPIGGNIQQVMHPDKQKETFGDDYVARALFIPEEGDYISADARQVEYRVFGSYANSKRILEKYAADPWLSFHEMIHGFVSPYKPDLTYKGTKNLNFMRIYGGGMAKLAMMLGYITEQQLRALKKEYPKGVPRGHQLLRQAVVVDEIYNRELPEVKPLLRQASKLAEERGYVKTILGRRTRFPDKMRLHKALNGVIQGTAADINKRKLAECHANRKHTGLVLRVTSHDELCGDGRLPETVERVREILDSQSFPQLRIPILWDVNKGRNWAECA